jgi:hypothetical protein
MLITINHLHPVQVEPFATWPEAVAAIEAATAASDADPESNTLNDIEGDIEDRLFATPAPDIGAIAYKRRRVLGRDVEAYDELIAADLARFPDQCNRCRFWGEDVGHNDPNDPDWGFGGCRLNPPTVIDPIVGAQIQPPVWGSGEVPDDIIDTIAAGRSPSPPTGAENTKGSPHDAGAQLYAQGDQRSADCSQSSCRCRPGGDAVSDREAT